jgi:hypothetical protein
LVAGVAVFVRVPSIGAKRTAPLWRRRIVHGRTKLGPGRRVEMSGGPFFERIGLPHSVQTKTDRLAYIRPPGFPGSRSTICAH